MSLSTSRKREAIFDTNVLSLLAKIERLDVLQRFRMPGYITPAIHSELQIGLQKEVHYLQAVLELLYQGILQLLSLSATDKRHVRQLPAKLGAGEAEAIILCQRQLHLVFVSHDRKALNYCKKIGVLCLPFMDLAQTLHQSGILDENEIQRMFS